MVIELKMTRFETVPWGFRLVGGSDFDIPLTVVMIKEGGVADQQGLKVGDVIVRINDEPTLPMSHADAHRVISNCGNNFFFAIHREDTDKPADDHCTMNFIQYESPESSPLPDNLFEPIESDNGENEEHEELEEDIAAVLSGEAEVLKDHNNVIGVNFNRIFPKPGVCKSSEVLKELNDEAIKTKDDKEKEKRKWTTFLQKPNRPIPKSKQQLEAEARAAAAYKVQIVIPSKQPSPQPKELSPEPEPVIEKEPTPEPEPEDPPADNEVPDLDTNEIQNELLSCSNLDIVVDNVDIINEAIEVNGNIDGVNENDPINSTLDDADERKEEENYEEKYNSEYVVLNQSPPKENIRTDEEILLEKQLIEVQKQLLALSTLPSTIQATLDSVTRQLAELLPSFKLQSGIEKINEDFESVNKLIAGSAALGIPEISITPDNIEAKEKDAIEENEESYNISESEKIKLESNFQVENVVENPVLTEEELQMSNELKYKKDKDNVITELEGKIQEKKRKPKGPRKLFGPLVPQQRPQILPGGRRWYRPKDAYNEEFIAETISAQAELLIGTTLGPAYESPHLGFDPRVNFMKYQKPEIKLDIDKSEVYKVVHHLDRDPIRGIEIRPPVVPSADDIQNKASAISCG